MHLRPAITSAFRKAWRSLKPLCSRQTSLLHHVQPLRSSEAPSYSTRSTAIPSILLLALVSSSVSFFPRSSRLGLRTTAGRSHHLRSSNDFPFGAVGIVLGSPSMRTYLWSILLTRRFGGLIRLDFAGEMVSVTLTHNRCLDRRLVPLAFAIITGLLLGISVLMLPWCSDSPRSFLASCSALIALQSGGFCSIRCSRRWFPARGNRRPT